MLSLQLPFAILPLIRFTNTTSIMDSFTSPKWLRGLAHSAAPLIISLNVWLVLQALGPTAALASAGAIPWVFALVGLFCGSTGLDHFFAAAAYTLTQSVIPEGRKCATQGRRQEHAGSGRRNTFPALTVATVPVARHDIEGDTYLS